MNFQNIFSLLVQDENKIREVHKILEKSTLELFTKLFSSLTVT